MYAEVNPTSTSYNAPLAGRNATEFEACSPWHLLSRRGVVWIDWCGTVLLELVEWSRSEAAIWDGFRVKWFYDILWFILGGFIHAWFGSLYSRSLHSERPYRWSNPFFETLQVRNVYRICNSRKVEHNRWPIERPETWRHWKTHNWFINHHALQPWHLGFSRRGGPFTDVIRIPHAPRVACPKASGCLLVIRGPSCW